jgi:hypothetical protein
LAWGLSRDVVCSHTRRTQAPSSGQAPRDLAKATEHAREYSVDDWTLRVDDFEIAELLEFL